ncbi:hypothetical protein PF008_g23736 [Phytophthora fragariae]|uniref:Uncharacterized protein n=1 Tax=Phytophthora fragariae TaxID=53985 RepID=A0A6G0QQJ9_9STRA|nr:hypothetical protein PF008_g23736 [Phytophthora fragariae]
MRICGWPDEKVKTGGREEVSNTAPRRVDGGTADWAATFGAALCAVDDEFGYQQDVCVGWDAELPGMPRRPAHCFHLSKERAYFLNENSGRNVRGDIAPGGLEIRNARRRGR